MKAGNGSTGAQARVLTGRWPRPGPSGLGPDGDLRLTRRQCALALASIVAGVAVPGVTHGQSLSTEPKAAPDFKPVLGQEGRDVVWIPSDDTVVQRILALAQVGPADRLVDLGSGDGRIPIAAALSAGARAVGVEFSPGMVAIAREAAQRAGVAERVSFVQGDLFAYDFSDATVVTLFLLSALNLKLRPALLKMRPGTRIVSHLFDMGGWLPDATEVRDQRPIHLWRVPADAGGHWRGLLAPGANDVERTAPATLDLKLTQTFQVIDGGALLDGRFLPLERLHLSGDGLELTWRVPGAAALGQKNGSEAMLARFSGRIEGDRAAGTLAMHGKTAPLVFTRLAARGSRGRQSSVADWR